MLQNKKNDFGSVNDFSKCSSFGNVLEILPGKCFWTFGSVFDVTIRFRGYSDQK